MSDLIDLAALLAEREPEPEPEHIAETRILHDPARPTRAWLRGARKGSGPWKARHLTWRVHLAMIHHQQHMLTSDWRVLDAILRMMQNLGTDRLTVAQWEIAKATGMPRQTVWDAMNRLMADGWLRRISEGFHGKPRGTGTGRAAVYRVAVPLSPPPSRRQVVCGSKLDGRAKPSREAEIRPATKLLSNLQDQQIPVSDRAAEDRETVEILTGETVEIPSGETVEIPAPEWLRERLSRGPEMTRAVLADGLKAGYSRPTLYRAAKALGVVSTSLHGFAEGYGKPPRRVTQWELP